MAAMQGPESSGRIQIWFPFPVNYFKICLCIFKTVQLSLGCDHFQYITIIIAQYTMIAKTIFILYTYLLPIRKISQWLSKLAKTWYDIYFIIPKKNSICRQCSLLTVNTFKLSDFEFNVATRFTTMFSDIKNEGNKFLLVKKSFVDYSITRIISRKDKITCLIVLILWIKKTQRYDKLKNINVYLLRRLSTCLRTVDVFGSCFRFRRNRHKWTFHTAHLSCCSSSVGKRPGRDRKHWVTGTQLKKEAPKG